jgi:phage terminase small subunit
MARPKKPTQVKRLAGTFRADRETGTEPEIDPARPDAPAWLTGSALVLFDELADELAERQIVGIIDRHALVLLVCALDQLENQFMAGEPVQPSMIAQVRGLMRSFGLSPADRAALNLPAPVEQKLSGFAALARQNGI